MTDKRKYRVIIADDHPLLTAGLKLMIDEWEEFEVTGTCNNGLEACALCNESAPDLVIMDMFMPEVSGAEAIRLIKRQHPDVKILALTTFDDDETIKGALAAGCDGFLLKAIEPDLLRNSLLSILEGVGIFDEAATRTLRETAENGEKVDFSEREIALLRLIADGLTNAEIAEKLELRIGTVKNLVSLLLSKTNAASRSKLVAYAVKTRII